MKCPLHGWSNQILKNLFKGHGCNKCGVKRSADKQRGSLEKILNKFNKTHDNKNNNHDDKKIIIKQTYE